MLRVRLRERVLWIRLRERVLWIQLRERVLRIRLRERVLWIRLRERVRIMRPELWLRKTTLRRLRRLRTGPAAKALRTALHEPGFLALCREYGQQLKMKAETQALLRRVHHMVELGGAGAVKPAAADADGDVAVFVLALAHEQRQGVRAHPALIVGGREVG